MGAMTENGSTEIMQPRLAATLIIARADPAGGAPHFLMVQRSTEMAFAAGALVFPGGAVDAADHEFARTLDPFADLEDLAGRIAAVRETIEEIGLVPVTGEVPPGPETSRALRDALHSGTSLDAAAREHGISFDFGELVPFARWCPPQRGKHARRFDTLFYIAVAGHDDEELKPDGRETTRVAWYSAQQVLDEADAGLAHIIFPTRRNLERLAQCRSVEDLIAHARAHPVTLVCPWTESRDGVDHLCIPEGIGYPVTSEVIATALRG